MRAIEKGTTSMEFLAAANRADACHHKSRCPWDFPNGVNKKRCGGNNVVQIILDLRSFVIVALLGKGGPQPGFATEERPDQRQGLDFGGDPVKALD